LQCDDDLLPRCIVNFFEIVVVLWITYLAIPCRNFVQSRISLRQTWGHAPARATSSLCDMSDQRLLTSTDVSMAHITTCRRPSNCMEAEQAYQMIKERRLRAEQQRARAISDATTGFGDTFFRPHFFLFNQISSFNTSSFICSKLNTLTPAPKCCFCFRDAQVSIVRLPDASMMKSELGDTTPRQRRRSKGKFELPSINPAFVARSNRQPTYSRGVSA
jgi:hypothetical protein